MALVALTWTDEKEETILRRRDGKAQVMTPSPRNARASRGRPWSEEHHVANAKAQPGWKEHEHAETSLRRQFHGLDTGWQAVPNTGQAVSEVGAEKGRQQWPPWGRALLE